VLDLVFAAILVRCIDPVTYLFVHTAGDADATGIRKRFDAGRDIDAFTVNVVPIINDVAEIHPHAKIERAGCQTLLECDRTFNSVLDRWELDQETVTGELDDPPGVIGNNGFYNVIPGSFPRSNSAVGILFHEARIARHIGSKNSREPASIG
jgi:hypothetical protein